MRFKIVSVGCQTGQWFCEAVIVATATNFFLDSGYNAQKLLNISISFVA
jgi:hypothetical protein